jgi:hypothetical protein
MKKQPLIVTITVFFFVLLMIGCTQNTNTSATKFIGTWKTIGSASTNETWIFYQNGTVKNIQYQVLDEIPFTSTAWFIYEVNDTDLCLSSIEGTPGSSSNYSECFSYEFSQTMDRVTLSFEGTEFMVFTKVS